MKSTFYLILAILTLSLFLVGCAGSHERIDGSPFNQVQYDNDDSSCRSKVCSPREPLSEESCRAINPVYSAPFSVAGVCDPAECGPPLGMPNWLCPDGESIGGPTDRCLSDPDTGVCGWEIADCPE